MTRKEILIKGTLVSARYGKGADNEKEKYTLTVDCNNISDFITDVRENYANSSMRPKYLDGSTTKINISSLFDYPLLLSDKVENTDYGYTKVSEFIEDGYTIGAEVIVKATLKDGATYPKAIVVNKLGVKYNPFEGMEV